MKKKVVNRKIHTHIEKKTMSFATNDFIPENYLEEITACVNGHRYGPMTFDRRVINITVSAEGLPNSRLFSKKDPMCALFLDGPKGNREYARTEVCWNSLNPFWVRPFTLGIYPDTSEVLIFMIYDIVNSNASLDKQKLVGSAQIDLVDLLAAKGNHVELELYSAHENKVIGKLKLIYVDVNMDVYGSIVFNFRLRDLISSGLSLGRASPFFIIQRMIPENSQFINVYKSKILEKTKNPEWYSIELIVQSICGGDLDIPLRFNFLDYLPRKSNDLLGFFDTTLRALMETRQFSVVNNDGHHVGKFNVEFVQKLEHPRFYDYTVRGVKLRPMIAIDFSSTDIDTFYSNRMQHVDTGLFSYQAAMTDICDSTRRLTEGQSYFGYGFADFPGSKCFPLTMNPEHEDISSIRSLLNAYSIVKKRTLYPKQAPLKPVIQRAREIAKKFWEEDRNVLLLIILTNGVFCDLQDAIDELVEAENEPIITLMMAMYGTRRDLESKIVRPNGRLVHSNGTKSHRQLINIVVYHDDKIYPDHKLVVRVKPLIKNMACEYLRTTNLINV